MDIGAFLNFSFVSWLKDKQALKYLALLSVFTIIFSIVSSFVSYNFTTALLSLQGTPSAVINAFFGLLSVATVIGLIYFVIIYIIQYFIFAKALGSANLTAEKISVMRLVRLIILDIASVLVALLSMFNLKFLWIVIAAIVLFVGGIVLAAAGYSSGAMALTASGGALAVIGIILTIVYLAVVVYNSIRLSMGTAVFIEKERSIMDCLRISWEKTDGKVWEIIAAWVVVVVIMVVISFVASIPAMIYAFIVGFTSALRGVTDSQMIQLALSVNPAYLILSIPIYIASAFIMIVSAYYYVSIYKALGNKQGSAGAAVARAAAKSSVKPKRKLKKKR